MIDKWQHVLLDHDDPSLKYGFGGRSWRLRSLRNFDSNTKLGGKCIGEVETCDHLKSLSYKPKLLSDNTEIRLMTQSFWTTKEGTLCMTKI